MKCSLSILIIRRVLLGSLDDYVSQKLPHPLLVSSKIRAKIKGEKKKKNGKNFSQQCYCGSPLAFWLFVARKQ